MMTASKAPPTIARATSAIRCHVQLARPVETTDPVNGPSRSQVVCPVDPDRHDHRSECDERPPSPAHAAAGGRRDAAQRDDERDGIQEVAIPVLEPATAVIEKRRD